MKRMTVLTGYRMEVLKQHDRKKYDRLNKIVGEGLKKPAPKLCPHCVGETCDWYGTGVCLGGMK